MSSGGGVPDEAPRRTARVSNCQHPGLLLKSQLTRRTSAQKQADDKKAADALAERAAAAQEGMERVAGIEHAMETSQVAASIPVKPVRPRAKVVKKATTEGKMPKCISSLSSVSP